MDTLSNETGIKWELAAGKPLLVAFAGQAHRLYEFEHFEFVKSTSHADCSKIYCLDPYQVWYQRGINDELNTIPKVVSKLEGLIAEACPSYVRFIGVSAGGFAATLFGHLLSVDSVYAFGCQTFLTGELESRYYVPGMEDYDTKGIVIPSGPDSVLDLEPLLRVSNNKTDYELHIGSGSVKDGIYARHIEHCRGVSIKHYPCSTHACASQMLRDSGRLSSVVLEGFNN